MSNLFETNNQVLTNLSQLQQQEKELYAQLENLNLSSYEQQRTINKINELSQLRINMYSNLQNLYRSYENNVTNASNLSNTQKSTIDVIEDELNETKRRLNEIKDLKNTKLRTVEINNYYAKRYNAYKTIMFIVALSCIPILFLTILNNNDVLSSGFYSVIVSLIIAISGYFVALKYIDMSNRDNNNWDSYSWYFNKSSAPKPVDSYSTSNSQPIYETIKEDVCTGDECCSAGYHYDFTMNQCVQNKITPIDANNANNSSGCLSGEYYDASLQMCRPFNCPTGATLDKTTNKCKCPPKTRYDSMHKKCVSCPTGSTYSYNSTTQTSTCICPNDSVFDQYNNKCLKCPANSIYDKNKNSCICDSPMVYNMNENKCEMCNSNTPYTTGPPSSCKCAPEQMYNGYTAKCESCPDSAKYNPKTKTCDCMDPTAYYDPFANECMYKYNNW